MRSILIVVALVLASSVLAAPNDVPVSIDAAGTRTLDCRETLTGSDARVKVETAYTVAKFPSGASSGGVTRRTVEIHYRKHAVSTVSVEIPTDVTWATVDKHFLQEPLASPEGLEYEIYPIKDKKDRTYPGELLRLRAAVPEKDREADRWGFTVTHYSIRLILPELRIQLAGPFVASGYMDYSILNQDGKPVSGLTLGLAQFTCTLERNPK